MNEDLVKKFTKAIVIALLHPVGIGAPQSDISFKNLDVNAEKIVDHCFQSDTNGSGN